MRTDLQRGLLVFSIDCELHTSSAQLEMQRAIREVVSTTRQLFDRHQIPATWSVSDPATSYLRDELTSAQHELAVDAGAEWGGRGRFIRQLSNCCGRALVQGLALTTLVSRSLAPAAYSDLLVERGISVIRGDKSHHCSVAKPTRIHAGLICLPTKCRLPGRRTWLGDDAVRQARYEMRQAADKQLLCHITIDCQRLAAGKGVDTLPSIVELAARMRADTQLAIATMRDAASQLNGCRSSRPSQSILRAA